MLRTKAAHSIMPMRRRKHHGMSCASAEVQARKARRRLPPGCLPPNWPTSAWLGIRANHVQVLLRGPQRCELVEVVLRHLVSHLAERLGRRRAVGPVRQGQRKFLQVLRQVAHALGGAGLRNLRHQGSAVFLYACHTACAHWPSSCHDQAEPGPSSQCPPEPEGGLRTSRGVRACGFSPPGTTSARQSTP